ncbi:MAG: hypothetical protein NC393_13555 [Clostridium sp.]|nr:hypothetical protein [Clostridium sp.]MCM1208209.1 hypothetical protein [Ruminococcus sp.]
MQNDEMNQGNVFTNTAGTNNGYAGESPVMTGNGVQPNMQGGGVSCPRCGSTNLQAISDTHGKGAKLWKLCLCGFLGLCGAGKTQTEHYWVCSNCGNKFKM